MRVHIEINIPYSLSEIFSREAHCRASELRMEAEKSLGKEIYRNLFARRVVVLVANRRLIFLCRLPKIIKESCCIFNTVAIPMGSV